MEAGNPQWFDGNGLVEKLAAICATLALACLANASSAQAQGIAEEWQGFYDRLARERGDAHEETLYELADWFEENQQQSVGAEESLYVAAYVLASDRGWGLPVDDRLIFFEDAVRFLGMLENRDDDAAWVSLRAALMLHEHGRLPEACALLDGALKKLDGATQRRPGLLLNLAEWKRALGEYGEALQRLEEFESAAAEAKEVSDAFRVRLFLIRGQTYIELGLPAQAAPVIREGLQRASARYERGEALAEELILAQRISIWLAKSTADHEGALERIDVYLRDEVLYPLHSGDRAQLLCLAGTSALDLESDDTRPRTGVDLLRQSLELGLPVVADAHARFALAEEALTRGDIATAQSEMDQVRGLLRRWRNTSSLRAPFLETATLAALEARLAIQREDDPSELTALKAPIESALDELLERWAGVPELEGGVGFLLYGRRRAIVGELIQLTIALDPVGGPERALHQLMRVQGQGTLARLDRAPTPTLSEVQATLIGRNSGMLVYLPSDGASHVFAIDRNGVQHAALKPGETLERARHAYVSHLIGSRALLEDEQVRAVLLQEERRLARALSDLLLPTELRERVAGWSELTIVGSDLLGNVPFAWLPLGERPHLGVEEALTYQHSIPLAVVRSKRAVSTDLEWDLLMVTGVDPEPALRERWPELGPLPETHPRLLDVYDPARVLTLSRESATLASLTSLHPSRAHTLQFLGHGVLDLDRVRPSALVLAPDGDHDGLVWCGDAERIEAPQLVLLTACLSGRGPQRRGDPGATDMGGAWLSSGARAVVLALSEITYEQALATSRILHEELQRGRSPAEGLRVARLELVESAAGAAPFLDGLMRVVGLGHEAPYRSMPLRGGTENNLSTEKLSIVATVCFAGSLVALLIIARRRSSRA